MDSDIKTKQKHFPTLLLWYLSECLEDSAVQFVLKRDVHTMFLAEKSTVASWRGDTFMPALASE